MKGKLSATCRQLVGVFEGVEKGRDLMGPCRERSEVVEAGSRVGERGDLVGPCCGGCIGDRAMHGET